MFGARLERKIKMTTKSVMQALYRGLQIVHGEILRLMDKKKIGTSAKDRADVFLAIHKEFLRLKRTEKKMILNIMDQAKDTADVAAEKNGLVVKFSPERAKEQLEIVSKNGAQFAATQTENMERSVVRSLQNATVRALQNAALIGASMEETEHIARKLWTKECRKLDKVPQFIDKSGRAWNTDAYMEMNIRTSAAAVYNERMSMRVTESGDDLVKVTAGGDPHCRLCFPWENRILSITGKTKGFPTVEQAKAAGLFHPNCTHTLGYFNKFKDAADYKAQKGFPVPSDKATPDELFANKRDLDVKVKMQQEGKTKAQAQLAVGRDYLERSMRTGLIKDNAGAVIESLTDKEVKQLIGPNGRPPRFQAALPDEKEVWNHGSGGGVIHIRTRGLTAKKLRKVCALEAEG